LIVNQSAYAAYRTALLPVDMSEASARGIVVSRSLGLLGGLSLSVLHAHERAGGSMLMRAALTQKEIEMLTRQATRAAIADLTQFTHDAGLDDRRIQMLVLEGDAGTAILAAAKRLRFDLVVIGTRGHGGLTRTVVGSVTAQVLREIDCDILVVPRACKAIEVSFDGLGVRGRCSSNHEAIAHSLPRGKGLLLSSNHGL
jgi:nucleotide-binding universal stress UspA family protein